MDRDDTDVAYSISGMPIRLTAERQVEVLDPAPFTRLASEIAGLPVDKFWVDYDREADVLYVSFRRPQEATDSEMRDDGVLVRYRDGQVVGITVLDASKR
jgi:uncharacterized protein YuzE